MSILNDDIQSNSNYKHIKWIDSLKGICSVLIFFHHYILFFWPSSYYGDAAQSNAPHQIDTKFAFTPLSFFANGEYLVCCFLVLSALTLTTKLIQSESEKEKEIGLLKRLPQLAIPLLIVSLITWALLEIGVFNQYETNALVSGSDWAKGRYNQNRSIGGVFYYSLIHVWLKGGSPYSTAFWMLNYVFAGLIFAYFYSSIIRSMKWSGKIITYLCIFIAFFFEKDIALFFNSATGVLLGYVLSENIGQSLAKYKRFILILLFMSFFLGGYPSGVEAYGFYKLFEPLGETLTHGLGAAITIFSIIILNSKVLNADILCKLGKVSYAIYLIHIPVLL